MNLQGITELDRQLLSLFNGSDSMFWDSWMTVLTSGLTWIPLYLSLLYIVIKNNESMVQIFLVVGCALLCVTLSDGMTDFVVKPFVGRWRPSTDPVYKYTVAVVNNVRGSDYGFFSAHAANTFALAVFFSKLVKSKLLASLLIVWSLLNCYTRMYLGFHYPSDIVCGLLWGTVSGLVAYWVYRRFYLRMTSAPQYISSQYTSSGYNKADVDVVALVLCCTMIVTLFCAIAFYV